MNNSIFWLLLVVAILGLILFLWYKYAKKLKISNVYFVSGAVGAGKTFVSVALAVKTYKHNVRMWYLKKYWIMFTNLFRKVKKQVPMKPMLYSNIKLRYIKHNPFTKDILYRYVRIPDKSVLLLDETSLLADSMLFKDPQINSVLLVFFKFWRHYTHGGTIVANSQAVSDNHFSLKRCMSRYLYVYVRKNYLLFSVIKGREMLNSEDNQSGVNVINNVGTDLEDTMKVMPFLNRYFKYYDTYCYSIFTDNLTYQVDYDKPILLKKDSLKTDNIVTLQDFNTLDRRNYKNEKTKELVK